MSATVLLFQDSQSHILEMGASVPYPVPTNSECLKPVRQSPRGRFRIRCPRQEKSDVGRKM
jgi:hypothetical protein